MAVSLDKWLTDRVHYAVGADVYIKQLPDPSAEDVAELSPSEGAWVLPITDSIVDYAESVTETLREHGLRAEVDRRSEKLGWKIREGETMKVPYLLVVGQREAENNTVSLRLRHRRDEGVHSLDAVIERVVNAVSTRSREA